MDYDKWQSNCSAETVGDEEAIFYLGVFVGSDGLEAAFEELTFVDDEGALFE